MLSVTVVFEDLLDLIPVEGVEATVHAHVVGRWPDRITADDLGDEFHNVGIALPKQAFEVLMPDFERAITVSQSGTSDGGGELPVIFRLDEAFRRAAALRRNGEAPVDVGAVLSLDARVAGFAFEARFLADILADASANLLPKNGSVMRRVPVDFGKAIVGHVTDTSARLFFRLHGEIGLDDFVCEVHEGQLGGTPLRSQLFRPDAGAANTAVVDVEGLQPGTLYEYVVFARDNSRVDVAGAGWRLLSGSFRTADPSAMDIAFVFGSCHNPVVGPGAPEPVLRVWRALETRRDYEMLLLLGDQIYGDGIERPVSQVSWRDRYMARYDRFFIYPEMRQVLRRTPTYMILDDHEVVDDFGVVDVRDLVEPPNESDGSQRVIGALQAYDVWQRSHGPLGSGGVEDPKHSEFRHGPAAFFLLDNRTTRARDPERSPDPVLGGRQKRDLVAWADRVLESDVDLVFVAAPVPIAYLPVEVVRRLIDELKSSGAGAGALGGTGLGALVGAAVGGAPGAALGSGIGAAIGAGVGYFAASSLLNAEGVGDLTALDLADMWTFEANQKDLVFLLDLLFDIANDIHSDGTQGNRPRAVFLLGGDVHLGLLHLLRSMRPRHRRNPFIFQAVSSPLSNRPPDNEALRTAVEKIRTENDVTVLDVIDIPSTEKILERTFGEVGNAAFVLDDKHDANYAAEFVGILTERNFGRVEITRAPGRRVYRCSFAIQGENAIGCEFILDLNAQRIEPTRDHASFVRQSVPRLIRPATPTPVSVIMRNDGTIPWNGSYHLHAQTSDWLIEKVPLPRARVDPGEEVVFEFNIAALSVGNFVFQWRMGRSFRRDFGQLTPRTRITSASGQTGAAACREIRAQIRQARAEVEGFQADFASASPAEKPFLAAQVDAARARLLALENRARELGCP